MQTCVHRRAYRRAPCALPYTGWNGAVEASSEWQQSLFPSATPIQIHLMPSAMPMQTQFSAQYQRRVLFQQLLQPRSCERRSWLFANQRPQLTRNLGYLHIGPRSPSPEACPLCWYRCADTQSDRLGESFPMTCSTCPTQVYICAYAHVYTHVYTSSSGGSHTSVLSSCTTSATYTHVYTHVQTRVHTHAYTHVYAHVDAHVYTHVYTHTLGTHACTLGTHARTLGTHVRTSGTHARTLGTNARTHAHARARTTLSKHALTHTRAHAQSDVSRCTRK